MYNFNEEKKNYSYTYFSLPLYFYFKLLFSIEYSGKLVEPK